MLAQYVVHWWVLLSLVRVRDLLLLLHVYWRLLQHSFAMADVQAIQLAFGEV